MWRIGFVDGDDADVPAAAPPTWGPPENEIPVVVPLGVELVRTPDLAMVLVSARVTTIGLQLDVVGRIRPGSGPSFLELAPGPQPPGGDAGRLLGVEFADGRRGSDLLLVDGAARHDSPDPATVHVQPHGCGGSDEDVEMAWWVAPVPPPGPLTIVLRVPYGGPREVTATVDATPLAEARDRVVELWPWQPRRVDRPGPPPSPDLPADSWFRRLLDARAVDGPDPVASGEP